MVIGGAGSSSVARVKAHYIHPLSAKSLTVPANSL
jgi:hypothetical protein